MSTISTETIVSALQTIEDPELHLDIHTLGLIYKISTNEEGIVILMTLTTPFCPYADAIVKSVEDVLGPFGVPVRVDVTFEPEWVPPANLRIALGV